MSYNISPRIILLKEQKEPFMPEASNHIISVTVKEMLVKVGIPWARFQYERRFLLLLEMGK